MPRDSMRLPFRLVLSGLLVLAACGPVTSEQGLDEPLGARESALCSGLSVTSLSVYGVSAYHEEASGNGAWAVSTGANAVRLEYSVDGAQIYYEERVGTSGMWYFSHKPVACGVTHTLVVKAMPMVIDSAGNRATCTSSPRTTSRSFSELCPADSCEGKCGGTASNGCMCDDLCTWYRDCCADFQAWCGCPYGTCSDGSCCDPTGGCLDGNMCSP